MPLEQFLRAICGIVLEATILILPQIKLNSQLSRCTSFFSQQIYIFLIFGNLSVQVFIPFKIGLLPFYSCAFRLPPHSSTLSWKIPWMEEPGRLESMGSLRVGHNWATLLSLFTFMHWRRKWQPTPVFLPEESQGRGSLVGCHLWGRTESDTTEAT